jgi:hypothetical protein
VVEQARHRERQVAITGEQRHAIGGARGGHGPHVRAVVLVSATVHQLFPTVRARQHSVQQRLAHVGAATRSDGAGPDEPCGVGHGAGGQAEAGCGGGVAQRPHRRPDVLHDARLAQRLVGQARPGEGLVEARLHAGPLHIEAVVPLLERDRRQPADEIPARDVTHHRLGTRDDQAQQRQLRGWLGFLRGHGVDVRVDAFRIGIERVQLLGRELVQDALRHHREALATRELIARQRDVTHQRRQLAPAQAPAGFDGEVAVRGRQVALHHAQVALVLRVDVRDVRLRAHHVHFAAQRGQHHARGLGHREHGRLVLGLAASAACAEAGRDEKCGEEKARHEPLGAAEGGSEHPDRIGDVSSNGNGCHILSRASSADPRARLRAPRAALRPLSRCDAERVGAHRARRARPAALERAAHHRAGLGVHDLGARRGGAGALRFSQPRAR